MAVVAKHNELGIVEQINIFSDKCIVFSIEGSYDISKLTSTRMRRVAFIMITPKEMFHSIQGKKTNKGKVPRVVL